MRDSKAVAARASSADAREVVSGSLVQQLAQVSGLLVLLAIVTVLARRLTPAELGTYGLIATLAVYLLILRAAIGNAAVRAMTSAQTQSDKVTAFSTCLVAYVATGVITGASIAIVGFAIATGLLDGELARQAKFGAAGLGAVTAAGLAATINLDALRASLLLTRSAAVEIGAVVAFGALMLGLIAAGADLWLLIAANGSIPLISGTLSAASRLRGQLPWRFEARSVTRRGLADLAPSAGPVLVIEAASVVIYGLDRIVLGVFGSVAAVGRYEGPIRAHNVFYALNQALGVTALPTAATYRAAGDSAKLRGLAVRGSRYTLALTVPLSVTAMVLAGPALAVWLGDEYRDGGTALAILVSYWLLLGQMAVTPNFLVGAGEAGNVARTVAAIAALNLALSVALTPSLGLEGPALGTAISYLVGFPFLLRLALRATGADLGELAREAWLPAYVIGFLLAVLLVAARTVFELDSLVGVLALLAGGPLLYWLLYATVVLRPDERALARAVIARRPAAELDQPE